jgi:hypothetical protein
LLLGLVLLLLVAWTCGALHYTFPVPALHTTAAALFATGSVLALVLAKRKLFAVGGILIGFVATLAWCLSISPTNERPWRTELA